MRTEKRRDTSDIIIIEEFEPIHIRPDLFYEVIAPLLSLETTSLDSVRNSGGAGARTGLETLDEQLQKMMDECIAEADFSPIFPDVIHVYSTKDDQGNRISNAQMKQRTEYHLQGKE